MGSLEWIFTITWLAIGLSVPWLQLDLVAPADSVDSSGIKCDGDPDSFWQCGDWRMVWQMYCGAQYL